MTSFPTVSSNKQLTIYLDAVPKFLVNLVQSWSPKCMIVSFKLETDPNLLLQKARLALSRYQHDLVIGNLLSTRKWEVVFITPDGPEKWVRAPVHGNEADAAEGPVKDRSKLPDEPAVELESLLVPAVIELHTKHIREHGS